MPLPFAISSFDAAVTHGDAEQLGRRRADDARGRVERVLAEQHEIEATGLELGGERLRDGESIERNRVGLELHGAVGAHAHRLAQRLLHGVGPDGVRRPSSPGPCFSFSCSATSTA